MKTTLRRLVLCLDGTWNNRDDSTNVLHHFSLAEECSKKTQTVTIDGREVTVEVTQMRFYNEGVGTGPLDRISGGGFGLGLEDHVRDAYNWLVQNYEDETDTKYADEIYIFGFSRGAYEARSLVGFIGMCGLPRRGAPLTVNQLWSNYCLLGREREERAGFWHGVFGTPEKDFRRITELVRDPWLVAWDKKRKAEGKTLRPNAARDKAARIADPLVEGQIEADLRDTEKLLVKWSRRVKITYLGVYDTVGAVGSDALAIPGLRSKIALHNNMRPTTIIQSCRHALAADENRSSFERTPFAAYLGEKTSEGENERGSGSAAGTGKASTVRRMTDDRWHQMEEMWARRIEQRWFVGAHSNVGGGYASNALAQVPLAWLLEGAAKAGLICEAQPLLVKPVINPEVLSNDSYGEFASPLWEMILRAKRNYRIIDPPPEVRANSDAVRKAAEARKAAGKNAVIKIDAGFSLVNINEQLDESVLAYWAAHLQAKDKGAAFRVPPPNLVGYAKRRLRLGAKDEECPQEGGSGEAAKTGAQAGAAMTPAPATATESLVGASTTSDNGSAAMASADPRLVKLANITLAHEWLTGFKAHFWLLLWSSLTAAGLAVTDRLFRFWPQGLKPGDGYFSYGSHSLGWLLAGVAAAFAIVDWVESRMNFSLAQEGSRPQAWPSRRALLDSIYWTRTIGVVLFAFAAPGSLLRLWLLGWHAGTWTAASTAACERLSFWWPVPIGSIAGMLLAKGMAAKLTPASALRPPPAAGKFPMLKASLAVLAALLLIPLVIHVAQIVGHVVFAALLKQQEAPVADAATMAREAGLLLLLELAFVYLWKAGAWTAEPMATANLGSIVKLQGCWTPASVDRCLTDWCQMVGDHHDDARAQARRRPQATAAECGMATAVRGCLWRDMWGYIPTYTIVFGLGSWYGAVILNGKSGWAPLGWLWLVVPLVTAAADYVEDMIELSYLTLHAKGLIPGKGRTLICTIATWIKFVGLSAEGLATLLALMCGAWNIWLRPEDYGWRGLLALVIAVVPVLILLGMGVWIVIYWILYPTKASGESKAAQAL